MVKLKRVEKEVIVGAGERKRCFGWYYLVLGTLKGRLSARRLKSRAGVALIEIYAVITRATGWRGCR